MAVSFLVLFSVMPLLSDFLKYSFWFRKVEEFTRCQIGEVGEDVISSRMLCFIRYLATNSTVQGYIRIFPCFLVLPSNLDPLNRLYDSEIDFQDHSCGELIFVVEKGAQHELQVSLPSLLSSRLLSTGAVVTLCPGYRHNSKIHHFMHTHATGDGAGVSYMICELDE